MTTIEIRPLRAEDGADWRRRKRRARPGVYWLTQEFDATARILYDRVAKVSPFIRYDR